MLIIDATVLQALNLVVSTGGVQVAFSNPAIIYQLKLQGTLARGCLRLPKVPHSAPKFVKIKMIVKSFQGLPAFGNYGLPDKSYGCA